MHLAVMASKANYPGWMGSRCVPLCQGVGLRSYILYSFQSTAKHTQTLSPNGWCTLEHHRTTGASPHATSSAVAVRPGRDTRGTTVHVDLGVQTPTSRFAEVRPCQDPGRTLRWQWTNIVVAMAYWRGRQLLLGHVVQLRWQQQLKT